MTSRAARVVFFACTVTSLGLAFGNAGAAGVTPEERLFQAQRCITCHRLKGAGGMLGPDLTHVGSRLPYETIDAILTAPRSVSPHAVMPAPGLLPEDREQLARFLADLD